MARKSKEQRLNEAKTTLNLWEIGGHGDEKVARFISDMVRKMEAGKYPTKGQRDWLDQLIADGTSAFPKVHNTDRVAVLDQAIETVGMSDYAIGVISDFRYKLKRGWELSEKQEAFLASLLDQAKELQDNGLQPLSESDDALLHNLIRHGKVCGRNDYYGYQQSKVRLANELEAFYQKHGTVVVSELDRLKKMFKGMTTALTEKKFPLGSLVGIQYLGNGMVVSDVYVETENGDVVVDILMDGVIVMTRYDKLRKRLRKVKNEVDGPLF